MKSPFLFLSIAMIFHANVLAAPQCSSLTCFHGSCKKYTCMCDPNWTGTKCDTPVTTTTAATTTTSTAMKTTTAFNVSSSQATTFINKTTTPFQLFNATSTTSGAINVTSTPWLNSTVANSTNAPFFNTTLAPSTLAPNSTTLPPSFNTTFSGPTTLKANSTTLASSNTTWIQTTLASTNSTTTMALLNSTVALTTLAEPNSTYNNAAFELSTTTTSVDNMTTSVTTTAAELSTTATTTTVASTQPVTTKLVTTVTMEESESFESEVESSLSFNSAITLSDGTVISANEPLPSSLSDPNTAEFKSLAEMYRQSVILLYQNDGVEVAKVDITGFRLGSIISDYIVTLRSLTSLTSEQIKEAVLKKFTALKETGTSAGGLSFSNAKSVEVKEVKQTKEPSSIANNGTTPLPMYSSLLLLVFVSFFLK